MPSGEAEHRGPGGGGPRPDELPTLGGPGAADPPSPPDDAAGAGEENEPAPHVPGYEILGADPDQAGGMGRVWKARRLSDGQSAAVKLPGPGGNESLFQREIDHLRALEHPNLVRYLDHGTATTRRGPRPFLAMEYIFDGARITRHAWEKGLGVRARLELFLQVCSAVGYLHRGGDGRTGRLIHRDLKPQNILVSSKVDRDERGQLRPDRVRLIDLGIATPVDPEAALAARAGERGGVGTLLYMAPEQFDRRGEALDCATDVYALGVVLYELLTGALPYPPDRQDAYAVKAAIEHHEIEPPARRARAMLKAPPTGVAPCACEGELESIVLRALARHPEHRFRTVDGGPAADDLAANIRALLDSRPLPMHAGTSYTKAAEARRWCRTRWWPRRKSWLVYGWPVFIAALLGFLLAELPNAFGAWMDRWKGAIVAAALPATRDNVLVIEWTEQTDLAAVRSALKVSDFTSAGAQRGVWGALMRQLAPFRPGVMLVDHYYTNNTPFDPAFIAGIAAVRAAGCPVIADGTNWFADVAAGRVPACVLHKHLIWARAGGDTPAGSAWSVQLLLKRGEALQPSMALAAVAHFRRPDAQVTYGLRDPDPLVTYHVGGSARVHEIPASVLATIGPEEADKQSGLEIGDRVARYLVNVPAEQDLARRTVDLADFLKLTEVEKTQLVANRAVILKDARFARDTFMYADGRILGGWHAHAAAISQLLQGRGLPVHDHRPLEAVLQLLAAALGVLFTLGAARAARLPAPRAPGPMPGFEGRAWLRRAVARWAILSAIGAVLAVPVVFLLVFRLSVATGVVYFPFAYAAAALLAACGCSLIVLARARLAWEAPARAATKEQPWTA